MRLLLILLLISSWANAKPLPQKLTFSSSEHPTVQNHFIPLLKEAYGTLGINIEVLKLPVERALKELNKGYVDGDIIRVRSVANDYKNIIQVPVPLTEVLVELYCRPRLQCDLGILDDENKDVAIVHSNGFNKRLADKHKANFYVYPDVLKIKEMVSKGRIDYFVFMSSTAQPLVEYKEFPRVIIEKDSAFHLLHARHKELAEVVAPELARVLGTRSN